MKTATEAPRAVHAAYVQGRTAFLDGRDKCPHKHTDGFNTSRMEWWRGWLDAKTEAKFGK